MLSRAWWQKSPSSEWVCDRGEDEEESGVWTLSKAKDPLCARTLSHWPDFGIEDTVQLCGNSHALLAEHKRLNTGGVVRTRFPPEPNGYLHIGHAKSMNMNFKLAFEKLESGGGVHVKTRQTVFRYDDTNPAKESKEFVASLRKDVEWMGWTPFKVTHTSDYFDALYEMALELIMSGKAYVCEQTSAEIEACRVVAKARASMRKLREAGVEATELLIAQAKVDEPKAHESPYRDRSVAESLSMFQGMRRGVYPEGAVTLRLKMDSEASNFNMFDQVAYRVKHCPHPHVGDKWCIYPTYDYTHCIIDSLEHVDYSICTLEFETRRESYYWVLDALEIYRPRVFEMSRLNLTYTVLSKRKLTKLVQAGIVRGWNDPRMPTISGLRRRGYSPAAINAFCDDVGVTRNENLIEYSRLQHFARLDLEPRARRRMAVKQPLKLTITDFSSELSSRSFAAATDPELTLALSPTLYIDSNDFRDTDSADFFGLAPDKIVRLRHAINIRCDRVHYDDDKRPCLLECSVVADSLEPKGKLHWLSEADAVPCELRDYDHLFTVPKIDDDIWESQIDTANSEVVYSDALVHRHVLSDHDHEPIQFERLGFYIMDQDSTAERPVFNRTVDLRASAPNAKKAGVSRKQEQAEQLAKKEAAKHIHPHDMFKDAPEAYSQFDDDGVPTHDKDGKPLSKNAIKKLKKDWAKHKKLYDANQAASSSSPRP